MMHTDWSTYYEPCQGDGCPFCAGRALPFRTEPAQYDELSEDDVMQLQADNLRFKTALMRLGSMEAFHVGTAHVPEEVKLRVQFARDVLLNGQRAED